MFSAATKDSANSTVNEAKNTVYNAKRDLRDATDESKADLTLIAEKAGRKVRNFVDTANSQITEASDRVSEEIRTNPVRSSAIALGIGFVLGALFRR